MRQFVIVALSVAMVTIPTSRALAAEAPAGNNEQLTGIQVGARFQSLGFVNSVAGDFSYQPWRHLAFGIAAGHTVVTGLSGCDGVSAENCRDPFYFEWAAPFVEGRFDVGKYFSPYARLQAGAAYGAQNAWKNTGLETVPLLAAEAGLEIHASGQGLVGRMFVGANSLKLPAAGVQLGWRW
jgi:hypothetical protein